MTENQSSSNESKGNSPGGPYSRKMRIIRFHERKRLREAVERQCQCSYGPLIRYDMRKIEMSDSACFMDYFRFHVIIGLAIMVRVEWEFESMKKEDDMQSRRMGGVPVRLGETRVQRVFGAIVKYRYLHLMLIPGLLYFFVFKYIPMYGIMIAFKNYKGAAGGFSAIIQADWIGFKNFEIFFKSLYFGRILSNTIYLSILRLLFSFTSPILLALLINELRTRWFKRTVQTITYMPYFLSWVVVAGLLNTLLSPDNGVINAIIKMNGGTPVYFLASKQWFRPILIISEIWKSIGYGSIVYLAAITGVDQQQFEAARVDGANKLQQIIHITLPAISEIIAIMLILQIGKMFDDNFDQIYNLYSPSVYEVSDVFETYVYRNGIQQSKFSYASAVGLVKSILVLTMIMLSNAAGKKLGAEGLF